MEKRFCEWRISGVAWARNWSGKQWPPLKGKGNPSHFGLASKQIPSFVGKPGVGPRDTNLIHAVEAAPLVPSLPYFWYLQVEKINKNKLCLPMNPRAVLTIKGLKKGAVILHHCKAENVVVRAKFPYLHKLGVYLEYHKPVHSPSLRKDGATWNPSRHERKTCKDCQS